MSFLEINEASFHYRHQLPILQNISFELRQGEILAVVGRNGTGKTTFLKCLLGLLNWTAGDSLINGQPTAKQPFLFGYVTQAKPSHFSYTVRDFIVFGRSGINAYLAAPNKQDYQQADWVMAQVGIDKLGQKACHQLSGGELQMVYLARALVSQPSVLVLDEPETGLDFYNQRQILDLLQKQVKDCQTTIIINSHYINNISQIADKCLLLGESGHVFGETQMMINRQTIKQFFKVDAKCLTYRLDGLPRRHFVFV